MIKKWFLLFALIVSGHASGQTGPIVIENYAGVPIRLVIPKGYCAIPRDDPLGSVHYQYQEENNKDRNRVAVLFADCKEWSQRVADNSYRLRHHGSYLFQFVEKQEKLLPPAYTLERYIAEVSANVLRADGMTSDTSNAKIVELLKKKLETSKINGPTIDSPMNLGLIDKNELALFFGVGITVKYPTETPRINAVTAMTMVKQVPLSINLYSDHDPKANFSQLLALQKQAIKSLIDANR